MTLPRKLLISDYTPGVYHCISRCVRRAFLCGEDRYTGENFDHRKDWVDRRLKKLASIFAVDVGGRTVMDNHMHLVLRNRPDLAEKWEDLEVARRWRTLYPKRQLSKEFQEEEIKILAKDEELIEKYRNRLQSISWFMKSIKEYIAKKSNREDEVTGSFWEGRFKSIELLDEKAILNCLVYVDLNPIRAKISSRPEESNYTSIQERIIGRQARVRLQRMGINLEDKIPENLLKKKGVVELLKQSRTDKWLAPLNEFISMSEDGYIKLVDLSGRILDKNKAGFIPEGLEPILKRLNIEPSSWEMAITNFGKSFSKIAGTPESLQNKLATLNQKWIKGVTFSKAVFSSS